MTRFKKDDDREQRIIMEVVVDAYNEHERAMGCFYYLADTLHFPFFVKCIAKRVISPLRVDDEIEVIAMAPEEECEKEMFVMIRWDEKGLAIPLSQIKVLDSDEETKQAVEDWHYWLGRGYQF
jgi:hypothetical protein